MGRTLLAQGLVTEKQIRAGLDRLAGGGGHLGQVLIDMGFIGREEVRRAVARHLRLESVDLDAAAVSAELAGMVPGPLAARHRLVPVSFADGTLTVAVDDPHSLQALGGLRARLGCRIRAVIGDRPAVSAALERLYGPGGDRPVGDAPAPLPVPAARPPAPPEAPPDPLVGRTVAYCRVLRPIGRGGAGDVYLAEQAGTGQPVAIKVIHERLLEDPDSVERFEQEARAAAGLEHPDIVRTLAVGRVDGRHFIVMEYIEGLSLAERLDRDGRLSGPEALAIAARVAGVLAAAHECGILHLDIKPGNVMLPRGGGVKVADFGVSRDLRERAACGGERIPGTPTYMAPERLAGARPDCHADLYGLGVTLYEMLSGRLPLAGYSLKAIARQHAAAGPAPLSAAAPDVPADVAAAVMRLLARDPAERFGSAREAAEVLRGLAAR